MFKIKEMDYNDPKINPFAKDRNALSAVRWLTGIMREKVNPNYCEADAWEFYIENKAIIEAEQNSAEEKAQRAVG